MPSALHPDPSLQTDPALHPDPTLDPDPALHPPTDALPRKQTDSALPSATVPPEDTCTVPSEETGAAPALFRDSRDCTSATAPARKQVLLLLLLLRHICTPLAVHAHLPGSRCYSCCCFSVTFCTPLASLKGLFGGPSQVAEGHQPSAGARRRPL